MPERDAAPRRLVWAWVGVGLAVVAAIAWFVVTSIALDSGSGSGAGKRGRLGSALAAATPAEAPFAGLTEVALGIDGDCRRVVVADDDAERGQGLRARRSTVPYDGMLFVFDEDGEGAFTMSGVPVPLDIGFYDAAGRPVSRVRMEPCDGTEAECPVYVSDAPYRYALETEAGALGSGALGACPS